MNYDSVDVTISRSQLQDLIREQVSKDFPNHYYHNSTIDADGDVIVSLKKKQNGVFER